MVLKLSMVALTALTPSAAVNDPPTSPMMSCVDALEKLGRSHQEIVSVEPDSESRVVVYTQRDSLPLHQTWKRACEPHGIALRVVAQKRSRAQLQKVVDLVEKSPLMKRQSYVFVVWPQRHWGPDGSLTFITQWAPHTTKAQVGALTARLRRAVGVPIILRNTTIEPG